MYEYDGIERGFRFGQGGFIDYVLGWLFTPADEVSFHQFTDLRAVQFDFDQAEFRYHEWPDVTGSN